MRSFAYPRMLAIGALTYSSTVFAAEPSDPPPLASGGARANADATTPARAEAKVQANGAQPTSVSQSTSASQQTNEETPAPEVWQTALTHYELGEADVAIEMLRGEIVACTVERTKSCDPNYVGTLYACLGIALSGGKADHNAGVQAFRKALSLSPEIIIYPTYQTIPVMNAYNEAKTGQSHAPSPQPAYAPANGAPENSYETSEQGDEEPASLDKKRWIMLLSAGAQTGPTALSYDYDDYYRYNTRAGINITGRATIGGMPGSTSGFTVGGRMTGGAMIHHRTFGHFGASGVLGSTIGKRKDGNAFYFFGSGGFLYMLSFDQLAPTIGFEGGAVLHGFNVGFIADFTASNRVSSILLGIEVGWGHLF